MWILKVPKVEAEKTRKKLMKRGLFDDKWSIVEKDDFVLFPVKDKMKGAFQGNLPPRNRKLSPYERIKKILNVPVNIPDYWEKIGDVLLLPPFEGYEKYGYEVGLAFSKILRVKTVCIYFGVEGELREPNIEVIYGNDTETVHLENGIRYALDVSKIMFSSGNVEERIRMGKIDAHGEVVVDMFAGIGYFTLPVAKYAGAKRVYACEKNPVAFEYLRKNIELNRINNVIPLLGDNREVAPKRVADRVIMGYVRTEPFLEVAMQVLKEEGGVVHYHDTFTTEEKAWKPEENVKKYAQKHGFEAEFVYKRVIKSYAPHIWHIVVDAHLTPKD